MEYNEDDISTTKPDRTLIMEMEALVSPGLFPKFCPGRRVGQEVVS